MTSAKIYELSAMIPEGSRWFCQNTAQDQDGTHRQTLLMREHCQWDVRFGWHFILSLVEGGVELDKNVHEHFLRQAYKVEKEGAIDQVVLAVLTLREPSRRLIAEGIEALLLTKLSLEEISKATGRPLEVIQTYEQLFFNVRDRLDDYQFIADHLYPQGRGVELIKDYHLMDSPGMLAKRVGWRGNAEDVRIMLGLLPDRQGDFNLLQDRLNYESRITHAADFQARTGLLHQQTRVQRDAKNMLATSKISGEDNAKTLDAAGITGGIGDAMLADVLRLADEASESNAQLSPIPDP